jgi:hypothetical protein
MTALEQNFALCMEPSTMYVLMAAPLAASMLVSFAWAWWTR